MQNAKPIHCLLDTAPRRAAVAGRLLAVIGGCTAAALAPPLLAQQAGTYSVETLAFATACTGSVDPQEDQASGIAGVASTGSGASGGCPPPNTAVATASGTASAGSQFVAASASANATGAGGSGGSGGGRSFSEFVVDAVALTGMPGTILFSFSVNGSVGTAGGIDSGFASAGVGYSLNVTSSAGSASADEGILEIGGVTTGSITYGAQTFVLPIVFGEPISFDLTADTAANASGGVDGTSTSAVAAFNNTFAWNGIIEVLDAANDPVAQFTALDAEGGNWVTPYTPTPVPLPAGLGLLLAGCAALAVPATRRRRLSRPR